MATGGSAHAAPNAAKVTAEAERCFDLKMKGKSLREIAAITGLSKDTVGRRIQHEIDARISPRVEDYRALQDSQLDALETHLWAIIDDPTADLDDKLKVMDRVMKLMDRRAKLHGVDAAVKMELSGTVQTQAEAELEGLFAEIDLANEETRRQIEQGA